MQVTLQTFLIVCPLVFLAGFIDSIAGGGGLISLPTFIFAGFPIHFAYGTNKFTASIGTFFSTYRFVKNKQFHMKTAVFSVVSALVGSYLAAKAALMVDEKYLQYCLIIMLPCIAIFLLTRRGFGEQDSEKEISDKKTVILAILSGLIIGAYDGFFGPGTGTFLILIYTGILGFNMTVAAGNAKLVNLASNVAALATFMANGKIMFQIGIPAALFGILGNWIGSGLAVKNGAKVIKPVLIVVFLLLFIKIGIDLFN